MRDLWPSQARQDSAQCEGRLLAPLDHVHMGVGAVAADQIGGLAHGVGNVAVQVEGLDDRHVRADLRAYTFGQLAVRIIQMGRDHGAVMAEIDRVHWFR